MSTRAGRCESGKIRYRDELAAKIALANTQRSASSVRSESRAYRCPLCRGWHLTSKPTEGGTQQ